MKELYFFVDRNVGEIGLNFTNGSEFDAFMIAIKRVDDWGFNCDGVLVASLLDETGALVDHGSGAICDGEAEVFFDISLRNDDGETVSYTITVEYSDQLGRIYIHVEEG